jgi:ribosome-associated heat shock protein Hsp15
MRLDRLLYCLRLARSRTAAQRWIGEGHIRLNGARVLRLDQPINVGDVLTLPLARKVMAVEISALPERRGPASEAQACYRRLDAGGPMRIAGHTRGAPASRPDNEGSA